MVRIVELLVLTLTIFLAFTVMENNSMPHNYERMNTRDRLRTKMLMDELDKFEEQLDKKLVETVFKKKISKRSDIDARLLELQAKILLAKAANNGLVGHGKFDFDMIGKRSLEPETEVDLANDYGNGSN